MKVRGGLIEKVQETPAEAPPPPIGDGTEPIAAHDVETEIERSPLTDHDRDVEGIPKSINGFQIERFLNRGAYGEVYLAWDARTERSVALKLLRSQHMDAGTRERFFREV